MTEKAPTAASLTRLALERIEDGGVDDARRLLAQALDIDARYEPAWLWFAHIAEEPGERKFALQQAVAANPESNARAELSRYQNVETRVPDELVEIGGPPLPPSIPLPTEEVQPDRGFRRRSGAGLLALVAIAAAIAIILFSQREQPVAPLYVAIAGGMSGSGAASGLETVQSARLYFDRLNAGGGVSGHPVELLIFDDQNDPKKAKQVAQEIVDDDRVMLVIGHSTSSTSVAASPIYEAAGLPAITSTATADNVTQSPWYLPLGVQQQHPGVPDRGVSPGHSQPRPRHRHRWRRRLRQCHWPTESSMHFPRTRSRSRRSRLRRLLIRRPNQSQTPSRRYRQLSNQVSSSWLCRRIPPPSS